MILSYLAKQRRLEFKRKDWLIIISDILIY